jgi:hypothetical protein
MAVEESDRNNINVISQNLSGGTKENDEKKLNMGVAT